MGRKHEAPPPLRLPASGTLPETRPGPAERLAEWVRAGGDAAAR